MTGSVRGEIFTHVALAAYNSWRVGGTADQLFIPKDTQDLVCFLTENPLQPLIWLGLGSNVLIRDGGIRGTVILTNPGLCGLGQLTATSLRIEAGVPCAKVAKFSAQYGLTGAEFLIGIPGTMGGALAMNAGAFGGETWPLVNQVETINRKGEIRFRDKNEFIVSYRHVEGLAEGEWFLAAHLELQPGDTEQSLQKNKALLRERSDKQPIGLASCGSVFRNPPGDYAARLIESCGLKGLQIGASEISTKHANFIVHRGAGRAHEIEALIQRIETEVHAQHGIQLQREVRILGDASCIIKKP